MPRLLKTLAEYVAITRKKETHFMVFNTVIMINMLLEMNKILMKMQKMKYLDI
ncbi:hypothetical protein [Arcobacter sp. AHV-9/2010]|uniref:hypothetical protein n=1 Tax=Arcobacter sp. AHV-9/2010 TaxID=2021861 RepID=UPI0013E952B0|nr:hypothetical protein [Arcobacter sp. CECT 9299]